VVTNLEHLFIAGAPRRVLGEDVVTNLEHLFIAGAPRRVLGEDVVTNSWWRGHKALFSKDSSKQGRGPPFVKFDSFMAPWSGVLYPKSRQHRKMVFFVKRTLPGQVY